MSNGTEIKPSPLGGKGIFAAESYAAGEVLISLSRPLIAVLDKARVQDTCSWCFSWTELPILSGAGVNRAGQVNWCTGCQKVRYCSKRCQTLSWKAIHKRECKELSAEPTLIPHTVQAVIQMMDGLSIGDKKYNAILELEAHRDDFEKPSGEKWKGMQLMVYTAMTYMAKKGVNVQGESARMAMCVLMTNSFRLVTPTFDPLGLALDPQMAKINHSCTPNAVIVFDGPRVTVRALDALQKGDEILISYIDSTAPFGVRQAELKDQYFFTCNCNKCSLGSKAPPEAFLEPGDEFDDRIKVIDDMIPEIVKDPAWPRHVLGSSIHQQRLSALQFYAYSYLNSPDAEDSSQDPSKFRKAIKIIRNTGVWPLTRAPMPALFQQYAVACLTAKRYNEALIAMLRLHVLIDPTIYPESHHPVRVVHAWTLATLAKAVGSDQDSPFCKALQSCGVDLSMLFISLLFEIREEVPKSHGSESLFGQMLEGAWQTMMEPGGELDAQYSQMGMNRDQWQKLLKGQIEESRSRIKAFAENEDIAAQIDEALAAS